MNNLAVLNKNKKYTIENTDIVLLKSVSEEKKMFTYGKNPHRCYIEMF